MSALPFDSATYTLELEAKAQRLRDLLAPFDAPEPQVFDSPLKHFRLRAEFRLWREGGERHYAMFAQDDKRTPILIEDFPIASLRINQLMPQLKAAWQASAALSHKLFQVEFLTTLAGENIRRTFMAGDLHIAELYDLGDTKLFQAAVRPAIIIATRTTLRRETPRFVSAYHAPTSTSTANPGLFDALNAPTSSIAAHNGKLYDVRVGTLRMPDDTKTPWRLSDPTADEWLATINAATWRSFGDVAKIRVGIKTTADNVFLANDWEHRAPSVEPDLLHPLITQHNITPWAISPHLTMRVLYPYDLTSEKRRVLNIDDWPGAKSYLLQHHDQLSGRAYVVKSGREWYEIWVPQRPALWAAPKIVFPDISDTPRFALDTSGAIVNGNCYWISLADVGDEDIAYLMLAVANSSLGVRYYDEVCGNRLYSGKRRWITQYINRLPLPYPDMDASRELIALAKQLVAGRNATGNRDDAVERLRGRLRNLQNKMN